MIEPFGPAKASSWMPRRFPQSHKGSQGRVLIIAGSRGMAGAAVLSASGAMRSGAGLVKLCIVKSQQAAAVKRGPLEVTTLALPENRAGQLNSSALRVLRATIRTFSPDVLAIGPGLGQGAGVKKTVRMLLRTTSLPVVLDADGINVFDGKHKGPLVMTPHEGELARLLKWSPQQISKARVKAVQAAAQKFRCVCLLKGPGTLVTDGRVLFRNTTGNPGMASGGMGDVLTGVVAGLWAQLIKRGKTDGLKAALLGAYLHGFAADLALSRYSRGSLLASDIIPFISTAIRKTIKA